MVPLAQMPALAAIVLEHRTLPSTTSFNSSI